MAKCWQNKTVDSTTILHGREKKMVVKDGESDNLGGDKVKKEQQERQELNFLIVNKKKAFKKMIVQVS